MMTQKFYAHTSDFYQISLNSTTLESAIGESQKAVQDEYRKWYETDTEYPYDPEGCTVPFRIFSESHDSDDEVHADAVDIDLSGAEASQ